MSNEITINGIVYVPKCEQLKSNTGCKYVIIRSKSAGVFAGYLKDQKDQTVTLLNSRRLWYWDGAASLSQLSQEGVTKPQNCKFPCEEPEKIVFEVVEIISATDACKKSINSVSIWKL